MSEQSEPRAGTKTLWSRPASSERQDDSGLVPEARLLVLCAQPDPSPHRQREIAAQLREPLDWTHIARLAIDHGVVSLLHAALARVDSEGVPPEIADALQKSFRANAERNRILTRELITLLEDLDRIGVPAIPFKGPTLASLAYGDLGLRQAGDLDVLVPADDARKVYDSLAARGYREHYVEAIGRALRDAEHAWVQRHQCEYLFFRRGGVAIEPHWAFAPKTFAVHVDHAALWERAIEIQLDGVRVRSLCLEDLVLGLCIHASKHDWSELRWICDIAALLDRQPDIEWDAAMGRAREQGCERMLLLGLSLAKLLFDAPCPQAAEARLRDDAAVPRLASVVSSRLFADGPEPPSIFTVSRFRMRIRERRRDHFEYAVRTLCTPVLEDAHLLPLPARLHFLYYPFKLVLHGLALPAWHVVRPLFRRGEPPIARDARSSREAWTARSRIWERIGHVAQDRVEWVSEHLLDAARLGAGERVLDLASGVGEPALRIAQRVGAGGQVIASDAALGMAAALQNRVRVAALRNLQVCVADMQALPFRERSFDRVTCRFGLMFSSDVGRTLAEVYRVLAPGGRVAFAVWGPRSENTALDLFHRTLEDFLKEAYVLKVEHIFRFAEADRLANALRRAGFRNVEERSLRRSSSLEEPEHFWRAHLESNLPDLVSSFPEPTWEALRARMASAFEPGPGEPALEISRHVRLAVGERP